MIETLIVIIGTILSALIGIFVLSRGPRKNINQVYAFMTFAFIVLMIANSFTSEGANNAQQTLIFIRIVAASTSTALASLYILVQLMNVNARIRSSKITAIIIATITVVAIGLSPLLFSGISIKGTQAVPILGPGAFFFIAHAFLFLILSVRLLIIGTKKGNQVKRSRNRSIVAGLIPVVILAPITSFVLPIVYERLDFIYLTPVYIVFFVAMVAYAMIRHGLFDIRLAAVRTFTYVLTLLTLSMLYYALAYLVSVIIFQFQDQASIRLLSPINIVLALLLAFAFQPIKQIFDRLTNLFFFRETYDTTEFFTRITKKTSSISELYALLRYASEDISNTLKAQYGAFSINQIGRRPIFVSTAKQTPFAMKDLLFLNDYISNTNSNVIVANAVGGTKIDHVLRKMMKAYGIAIVVPIIHESSTTSFLFLGEHLSSKYTHRDVIALSTIADELAIAIRNALSIHEIKKLNENLEQRIDAATKELRASNAQLHRLDEVKDEFMSMASHQLRTPLTSIKGYVSMLIDGDAGVVTAEQKHLLQEAFMSSERMVRLISDFLNVSRLQTGKFMIDKHPLDLSKLVAEEIDSLTPNAAARGLTFTFHKPKTIPKMNLDENKIQQVIMNFADNAIYYSKENSTIHVNLIVHNRQVEFTVKDTGIGVPVSERDQLFTKFFRATNARKQRPDGTGVGLFLAKKVIDAHKGSIIFESEEGKGSTFGFSLPLPEK